MRDFEAARTYARKLVSKHLPGMKVSIEPSRTRRSIADATTFPKLPGKGILRISTLWVGKLTEEELKDVILHEIAHLKVGCEHGHNSVWKAACVSIGADPSRVKHTVSSPKPSYALWCPKCLVDVGYRYGRPRANWHCSTCKTKVLTRKLR